MWERQAQINIAKRPGGFKKRIDELGKAGSDELPAANAQRASFQLRYRVKVGAHLMRLCTPRSVVRSTLHLPIL